MADAIRRMRTRGAPLIGATAAWGLWLALRRDASDGALAAAHATLLATRPTAVNLRWALERVMDSRLRVVRPVEAFGLKFPNAVGLAAGFDKDARAWPAAAALGFGHVEVGTVTALAQPGNPKPRAFRYPGQEAVIKIGRAHV